MRPIEKEHRHVDWDVAAAEKGGYEHFMLKEIHEQPEVISHTLANYIDLGAGAVRGLDLGVDLAKVRRVSMSACGTAPSRCCR